MWTDVTELRDFYATRLGTAARHLIRRRLRLLWPNLAGLSLLGLGYATPYLRQFKEEASLVAAAMPAAQGVVHWPPEGPNVACLAEEECLPFADMAFDRVLLVHALEHADSLRTLLREVWRVLAGEGRLIVVAPNRRGVWARLDRTPFGWGQPFSQEQLSHLLRESLFAPGAAERALYLPPTRSKWLIRSAAAWERVGTRWFPGFSGVVMLEAQKQLYTPTGLLPVAVPARRRARAAMTRPTLNRQRLPQKGAAVPNPAPSLSSAGKDRSRPPGWPA